MALLYYIGIFCTWAYNYVMIYVSRGMLKIVRDDLFEHMERLPVCYFDIKSDGDILPAHCGQADSLWKRHTNQPFFQALLPREISFPFPGTQGRLGDAELGGSLNDLQFVNLSCFLIFSRHLITTFILK